MAVAMTTSSAEAIAPINIAVGEVAFGVDAAATYRLRLVPAAELLDRIGWEGGA
jgi:hypothetical protein